MLPIVPLLWPAEFPIQTKPQLVCPVMGNAVAAPADLVVRYNGIEFHLCCDGCDDRFIAAPEQFIEAASEGNAAIGVFLFDPVTGNRVVAGDAKATRVHQGILYAFESPESATRFDAAPRDLARSASREGASCPVMKTPIKNPALASGFADHAGVRFYFCCPGCETDFAKDPAAFSAAAAATPSVARLAAPVAGVGKSAKRKLMPTCAGCAGEARLLADGQLPSLWTASVRVLSVPERAARFRATLDYRVTPRLSLGIERNGGQEGPSDWPKINQDLGGFFSKSDGDTPILPRGTWFITPEKEACPSVVLGITADRLSTRRGQAVFLTLAKDVPNAPITPFVSAKFSTNARRAAFPFGANVMVGDSFTFQAINDGDHTHLLFTHLGPKFSTSLILARTKYFGLGVSFGL
jgi:YHS domain-containing protein